MSSVAMYKALEMLGVKAAEVTFSCYQNSRVEEAQMQLCRQIANADLTISDASCQDHIMAVMHMFTICALKGTAKRNLHMLGQAIVYGLQTDILDPDKFKSIENTVADLSREEVLVLARYYACVKEEKSSIDLDNSENEAAGSKAWLRIVDEFVPNVFSTPEYLSAILGGLMRTGLVRGIPTLGGMSYKFTVLMDEICEFIDMDKAINEADVY